MGLEVPNSPEHTPNFEVQIEDGFTTFVPDEFKDDPFNYFEQKGVNIKSGEKQYDEEGRVVEDPTATKDLPVWSNELGEELYTVGKKVNTIKSQIGKSGDPFYEYSIMELAREFGLPAPLPIAKIKRGEEHLIVMKKVEGIRWTHEGMKSIRESDLTEADKDSLLAQAQIMMDDLKTSYEQIGLYRNWKLKDMVFEVDIPNKKVLKVTPTDWERTKIDQNKLVAAREKQLI